MDDFDDGDYLDMDNDWIYVEDEYDLAVCIRPPPTATCRLCLPLGRGPNIPSNTC